MEEFPLGNFSHFEKERERRGFEIRTESRLCFIARCAEMGQRVRGEEFLDELRMELFYLVRLHFFRQFNTVLYYRLNLFLERIF